MNRIVQVGDVFLGTLSGRTLTVAKVTDTQATMKWECHEWDRPLTPEGTLAEADLYTFIAGAPVPEIRKGDRVRTQGIRTRVGRVEAVLENGLLAVFWESGLKSPIRSSDVKLVTPAVREEKPAADDLMPGDRVRFRYNKKAGTVVRKTVGPWHGEDGTGLYLIQWDHRADTIPEHRSELVVLFAPRDTDAPLPAQKAIDEVDALREQIKAEVERLQAQLRELNGVKNKLKGVELH